MLQPFMIINETRYSCKPWQSQQSGVNNIRICFFQLISSVEQVHTSINQFNDHHSAERIALKKWKKDDDFLHTK